jgi:hypothetical protein
MIVKGEIETLLENKQDGDSMDLLFNGNIAASAWDDRSPRKVSVRRGGDPAWISTG